MALENKLKIESFDKEVLREYDIRGVVGNNINQNTAYTIGRTFGCTVSNRLKSNVIATGYDGRLTSPNLHTFTTSDHFNSFNSSATSSSCL